MGVKVSWNEDQTILTYDFDGKFFWDSVPKPQNGEIAGVTFNRSQTTVILNLGDNIGTGDLVLSPLRNLIITYLIECVVIVTTSRWISMMVDIIRDVYDKRNLYQANTLQDALRMAQSRSVTKETTLA